MTRPLALLLLLASPLLAQEPAPATDPLAAATYAEAYALTQEVTGLGAEAKRYEGGRFLAQGGFGRWGVNVRGDVLGLPGTYKQGQVDTYQSAEGYLSAHRNMIQVAGVTCGPVATVGYGLALDQGQPTFGHRMTGLVGGHCASGGRTVLVQAGSWQPLRGVAATVAVIWPLSEAISWHGDIGIGAQQTRVARIAIAVRVWRKVKK